MIKQLPKRLFAGLTLLMAMCVCHATTQITGEVFDSYYDGIRGASITLYLGDTAVASAQTDYSGEYEMALGGDLSGTYILEAAAAGYRTERREVSLTAAEAVLSSEDFLLTSSRVTINGEVSDASVSYSSPVSGAVVSLLLNGVEVASTTSYWGAFTLNVDNPAETPYTLSVSKAGYDTATQEVSLTPGADVNVSVKLWPEGTSPTNTSLKGQVYDSESADPIGSAAVELFDGTTSLVSTVTASDGNFEIVLSGMSLNGSYQLKVTADGYQDVSQTVAFTGGTAPQVNIAMTPEITWGKLTVYLTETGSSRMLSDVAGVLSLGGTQVATATSSWGIMELEVAEVSEAPYTLTLSLDGYDTLVVDDIELIAGETVEEAYEMSKSVTAITTVAGRTVDETTGRGVSSVRVALLDGEQTLDYEYTDDDGSFAITVDGKLNGVYILNARRNGYAEINREISIVDGVIDQLTLEMALQMTTVNFTVADEEKGTPVSGATVTIEEQYDVIVSGATDADGLCSVIFAANDYTVYELLVKAKGYYDYYVADQTFVKGEINDMPIKLKPINSALKLVGADVPADCCIYNVAGVRVSDMTLPGVYVITDGKTVRKIIKH